MNERRDHLAPLTSLRFFAALLIFIHHLWGKFGIPPISAHGLYFGVGVPFFFALSGFILAYNYSAPRDATEAARMIAYRIARVWPLHVACFGLFILLVADFSHPLHDLRMLWANLSLVQSWFGIFPYSFSFNAVSWSLSVELAFYIAFPFLVGMNSRNLLAVSVASSAIALVWATMTWIPNARLITPVVSGQAIVSTHPLASLPIFISGILAVRLFRAWNEHFRGPLVANILEVIAIAAFLSYMIFNREMGAFVTSLVGANAPVSRWIIPMLGIIAFVPSIIAFAVGGGIISRLLGVAPLVFLGKISFSFYLCHQPIINYLKTFSSLGPIEGVALSLGAALVVSVILFRLVEHPAQTLIRRYVDAALGPRPTLVAGKG